MWGQILSGLAGLAFSAPTIIDLIEGHTSFDPLGHKKRSRLLASLAGEAAVGEDLALGGDLYDARVQNSALRRLGRPTSYSDPTQGFLGPELEGAVQRERSRLGEVSSMSQAPTFDELAHQLGYIDAV